MEIRKYQSTDCKEMAELFYHTVHKVNAKDYRKEQLDVWATGEVDLEKWLCDGKGIADEDQRSKGE